MTAFIETLDTSTPAGSDSPKQGDDRIREIKAAIQERENVDHYWPLSGTTVDDADAGEHRKVTLRVGSAPSAVANKGFLYAKDVSAKAELFYRDEDGNEIQLTSGGILNSTSEFVSGDLLLSTNTSPQSGWTDVSATYEDKFIRVTSGTPTTTGGADTHTHAAGTYAGSAHTHGAGSYAVSGTTSQRTNDAAGTPDENQAVGTHTHTFAASVTGSSASDGGGAISGTSASGDNVPAYVEMRLFQRD